MNKIREYIVNCPALQFLMDCIRKRSWKQHIKDPRISIYKFFIYEISKIDNIIYKGEIIIFPQELSFPVKESFHQIGPQEETNLGSLIRQYFYYKDMQKHIDAITKSCQECQPLKEDYRKELFGI